jgi:hypothetical protein
MIDRASRSSLAFRIVPLVMFGFLVWTILPTLEAQTPAPKADPPRAVPSTPTLTPPSVPGQPAPPPPPAPPSPTPELSGATLSGPPPLRSPFQFKIDPKTPLKDLLPTPPKVSKINGPLLADDLSRVPEVRFEALHGVANNEAMKQIAHQIAKINHLNDKKTDGFLEALRGERLDLHGLPFAMGDACRTKGERSKQFALAVAMVRRALPATLQQTSGNILSVNRSTSFSSFTSGLRPMPTPAPQQASPPVQPPAPSVVAERPPTENFWEKYQTLCAQEDKTIAQLDRTRRECVTVARIAALMQVLAPMSPAMRLGLVKYLSTVSHVEATQALAKLAIFSSEEEIRKIAIDALKVRRERDYTSVLVHGMNYPWPAVARRAAEAVAKLERTDMVPQLIEMLEQPDPRAPVVQKIKQKRTPVVRELVRVNHHRNCLLCHAPGNTGKVSAETLTAAVPVPGQPLTPPAGGYNNTQPDILVRVDVTYLRQDFSSLQPVADANPWPEMQRFDFLVRERTLTDEECTAYREKLSKREPGEFSPYQRAALAALRDLTGRDTEPTPEAWRRLLKLQ